MALIPPDAGIRMRMQTEAQLQPLAPIRGIPADLPDLQPGQVFSARITHVLPDNTFRALVAGKELTLALPHGAKAGDTLELVVTDRSAKAVMAQLATPPELKPGVVFTALIQEVLPEKTYRAQVGEKTVTLKLDVPAREGESLELTVIDRSSRILEAQVTGRPGGGGIADAYPFTRLSPAAQMIGKLLVRDGQTPESAPLNGGQPLLASPPRDGAELVPKLAQAVSQSGLFYEAHQAQWVAGKLPTEVLLKEPQGQQQVPRLPTMQNVGEPPASGELRPQLPATTSPTIPVTVEKIPDALLPLVQQQLDAAATQRLLWHGEVWPGQTMEWEIQRDAPEREVDDAPSSWSTRLALTTPRLGRTEASLQLGPGGLRITLNAGDESSAADLRKQSAALNSALEAAGIPMLSLLIRHGQ